MDDHYTIEQRPDERGMLIYVVVQHGVDITSRWTRADAERALHHLDTLSHRPIAALLAAAAE